MSSGAQQTKPVEIAVFDFDGTSINGNSPVLLVRHLRREGLLRKRVFSTIIAWALAYKFRLPQDESWVRGAVFTAFEGMPKEQVDEYLARFYDQHLDRRFRALADEEINAHRAAGREVWAVSATFEPIIEQCMKHHGFTHQLSTRMSVGPDGTYTTKVEGLPVEGDEKIVRIKECADARYGEGNWILTHAYGDHHSDRSMLSAALHPCAVTPDNPLTRTAKREGWNILDWE